MKTEKPRLAAPEDTCILHGPGVGVSSVEPAVGAASAANCRERVDACPIGAVSLRGLAEKAGRKACTKFHLAVKRV